MAAGPQTLATNQQQTILVNPARLQLSREGEEETDRAGNRPGKEEDGSSDEIRGSENSSSDSDSD